LNGSVLLKLVLQCIAAILICKSVLTYHYFTGVTKKCCFRKLSTRPAADDVSCLISRN